ncbi:MAG TPA: Amuc_1098 family type IV pilus outer membrane protein, partial [Luteolibacter sp.]|nr:Amuc_1098 family type IV pilus outer membrane protein [Luteolibacter sp.]
LLQKGDEAYQQTRYAEALEAYAGAREMIPEAPLTAELRGAATQRLVQASIEHARVLAGKGDVSAAKAAVDKVLVPDVAPDDPAALAYRAQLDDPIRTNPALTAEHAKNVDAVRRALYTAEGAFHLGKFDEAHAHYEDVLRIDPTNAAARRGMERVAAAKSSYAASAYDQTRAEMLSQVDAGWETAVPATDEELDLVDDLFTGALDDVRISTKLNNIIIPRVALDQASLEEAVDFLRVQSREHDTLEVDPARKGVNITTSLASTDEETANRIRSTRFDLQLNNIPLARVLKYITDITQTSYSVDDYAVIVRPAGFTSDELITRTYRVPPDFLSNLSAGAQGDDPAADNPFAEPTASGGLLTTRLSAQEALVKQGVTFPEGAFANYNAATNTLRVTNTATNQDFIAQIVETLGQSEPVQVAVRVTMIRTERTNLEELGFDWLISPTSLNSGGSLFGGGGTVGNGSARTNTDFISPVNFTSIPGVPSTAGQPVSNIATAGLRSGDQAISGNSIDNIIGNPNRDIQSTNVAPGILSVTGLFTDGTAQMVMRGLSQKKNVDVMAEPSVVTRNGQASTVTVVREFIYPTEYEPPEIPTSTGGNSSGAQPVTPATPTAFEKRDVGMVLEVLPVAGADKRYIDLTVSPSFVEFDGFVNYGSPIRSTAGSSLFGINEATIELTRNEILMPVFSTQRANTQLTVADGSTIVIGGLMRESIENVEDKVPLLGDIPWVGRLFSSTVRQPVSTAIVFFVQVELLDPTGRPYRDR